MKSEAQVRQKLKQAAYRRLKADLLEPNFQRAPETCKYNLLRCGQGGLEVRCCGVPSCPTKVCDRRLNGEAIAKVCPFWEPLHTKEQLREAFAEQIQRPRHEVAALYPDLAALMWVLDDTISPPEELHHTGYAVSLPPPAPVSYLRRVWRALGRGWRWLGRRR